MSRRRSTSRIMSSAGGLRVTEPTDRPGAASRVLDAGELAQPVRHSTSAAARALLLPRMPHAAPRAPFTPDVRLDRGRDDRLDASPNVEVTRHLHPSWFAGRREIVEDAIHCPFIEDPVVAKAPEIELETLELEAEPVGHVVDEYRPEIRRPARQLSQLLGIAFDAAGGAERRELGTLHADGVVAVGIGILEGLEELWLGHGRRMAEDCGRMVEGGLQRVCSGGFGAEDLGSVWYRLAARLRTSCPWRVPGTLSILRKVRCTLRRPFAAARTAWRHPPPGKARGALSFLVAGVRCSVSSPATKLAAR